MDGMYEEETRNEGAFYLVLMPAFSCLFHKFQAGCCFSLGLLCVCLRFLGWQWTGLGMGCFGLELMLKQLVLDNYNGIRFWDPDRVDDFVCVVQEPRT